MLWVGVGAGKGFHPLTLGQTAAQEAMESLGKKKPDLVIVFSSSRLDQKEILQGVLSITGSSSLIGCSGVTQMTGNAVDKDLVVVALVSDSFRIQKGLGRGMRQDARKAGQEAAWAATRDLQEKGRFFLAFSDGLCGKGDDAIRGMQEVLGTSFPIIGASGADSFRFEKSFQYYDTQVLQDSLCGSLFFGNLAFGIGSRHGWLPLGRSRRVTRSVGNSVEALDGKPAVSIYEEYFGEDFYQSGEEPLTRKSLFYPLGLSRGREEWLIRQPLRVGAGGSLICAGEVPEGEEIRLMIGAKESLLEATRQAGKAALKGLAGKKARLVLVFESASRKKILGHDALKSLGILRDLFGEETQIAGCYDYGEKSPLESEDRGGESRFLNDSIVLLAIGE